MQKLIAVWKQHHYIVSNSSNSKKVMKCKNFIEFNKFQMIQFLNKYINEVQLNLKNNQSEI